MKRLAFASALVVALAGCSMAPHYARPAAPVAKTYPHGSAGADTRAAADIGWREVFTDPYLQQLIETALTNNRDLRVAALNIEAARARYRIQRADLLPSVAVTGSGDSESVPPALSQSGGRTLSRDYELRVGVTAYELDLFGRVQSLKNAALETYLATEETRRSAHISLVAEVADAYLTLRADRELLQLTADTQQSQQTSYDLTRRRFEQGVASEQDIYQAQIALETARADQARYRRQVEQDRNALTLLLGAPLPPLPDSAAAVALKTVPAGLPATLLQRRPDILAAEHTLKAANANIGAARAAFFPTITLTASTGTASPELSGLFDADTSAWSFIPKISLPIFSGGANVANLQLAKVEKNIDIAQYEKAIQSAFREVADALAARATLGAQLDAQQRLADAAGANYRLADKRYRNGVDSYLNVLDAQRSQYSARQQLIAVRLAQQSNRVALYKALGGGWIMRTRQGGA